METIESSHLRGLVVLTIPPSKNPSLGKTITVFSVSGSNLIPSENQPQEDPEQPPPQSTLQLPYPSNTHLRSRFLSGNSKMYMLLLSISFIALILWGLSLGHTQLKSRDIEDDDPGKNEYDDDKKPSSFNFPLYSKSSISRGLLRDFKIRLGTFTEFNSTNAASSSTDDVERDKNRTLASAVKSSTTLPVKGNIYPDGLYYTKVMMGIPAKPYFLDIDTGSDLAWVQCDAPCTSCAKGPHPLYKPQRGNLIPSEDSLCAEVQNTYRSGYCETCQQCDYEIQYADHSSSMGVLARDDIHLEAANGSAVNLKVAFGCAYDQQGIVLNSLTQTDGILGLSRAKVSLSSQMASQKIINNVVGHCLTADAIGGGYMFLGDDFVPQRKLEWVSMLNIPTTNSYVTEVSKITYGSKKLSLNGLDNGHMIFDSGSSYTYFTKQAYEDLVTMLQSVSSGDLIQDESDTTLPRCWRAKFPIISVSDVKQYFKTLTFQFGRKWLIASVRMRIPPEGYLVVSNKGNICLGIFDGSEVHDGATIVLGDVSLRGQLVVYDNVNNLIGWMQSDCVKPMSSTLLPSL